MVNIAESSGAVQSPMKRAEPTQLAKKSEWPRPFAWLLHANWKRFPQILRDCIQSFEEEAAEP